MRKKGKDGQRKLRFFKTLLLFFTLLLIAVFGKRIFFWFKGGWGGKSQLSKAIETEEKDILIAVLTPAKGTAMAIFVPRDLKVETASFGPILAGKLSLLAEQEKKPEIFSKSLQYFLKIPIDPEPEQVRFMASRESEQILKIEDKTERGAKEALVKFFSSFASFESLRIKRFLKSRETMWNFIDLTDFCKEEELIDGNIALILLRNVFEEKVKGKFADPLVLEENFGIEVYNSGDTAGLAQKIGEIIVNFGGKVVSDGNKEGAGDYDCLIKVLNKKMPKTITVRRLKNIFNCFVQIDSKMAQGIGDIKMFVKRVE